MDIFAGLPDEPEPITAEIVPAPPKHISRKERVEERLAELEASIYEDSLQTVDDILKFADVEPEQLKEGERPPEVWVEKLGLEGAKRRLRVAKYALLPKKDAPVGISVACNLVAAISNARAKTQQGPKTLNVQFVQISAPLPVFPEIEVEK